MTKDKREEKGDAYAARAPQRRGVWGLVPRESTPRFHVFCTSPTGVRVGAGPPARGGAGRAQRAEGPTAPQREAGPGWSAPEATARLNHSGRNSSTS